MYKENYQITTFSKNPLIKMIKERMSYPKLWEHTTMITTIIGNI